MLDHRSSKSGRDHTDESTEILGVGLGMTNSEDYYYTGTWPLVDGLIGWSIVGVTTIMGVAVSAFALFCDRLTKSTHVNDGRKESTLTIIKGDAHLSRTHHFDGWITELDENNVSVPQWPSRVARVVRHRKLCAAQFRR